MNRKISPHEEQAIDAMLAELHGQPAPDLSEQILQRLRETPSLGDRCTESLTSSGSLRVEVGATRRRAVAEKPAVVFPWKIAMAVAGIAAALLVVVWMGRDFNDLNAPLTAEDSNLAHAPNSVLDRALPSHKLAHDDTALPKPTVASEINLDPQSAERKPLKGIPLAMDSSPEDPLEAIEPPQPQAAVVKKRTTAPGSRKAVTLVAKEIDTNLHDYWSSLGIQAAQEADVAEIAERLSQVLGTDVPEQAIESVTAFESFLANPQIARAAAQHFLNVVTDGGFKKLDADSQTSLLNELANCFGSKQPFDETLAAWIRGDSKNSLHWYSANATDGIHPLARRFAALTMNVDVRCIKCHDSVIESRGTQSEYWSFAGLLERSVTRKNKKVLSVTTDRASDDLVFFETLDGRQKVVEAGVPAGWIAGSGDTAAVDLKQWSQRVTGSRELARGVVNSMWRMIHGRPLRGSVVDLSTPPHTESLGSLERRLVDDLIDSRFDIARTLALIVSTSSTRRSVPMALRADQIAMSSQADIDHGNMLVGAFAAAQPQHASLPVGKRVQFASRSVGVSLDAIQKETMLLAQTLDVPDSKNQSKGQGDAATKKANVTIEQFPGKAAAPPVQWLTLIDGLDEKVNHLAYLVPMQKVPKPVNEVVEKMVTEKNSEPLILHRVWWMIHP
ncbi:hypothetical protein RMSM_02014 [Rhodopirellula maiorica SM1]|uniref:DUF1549 domain-containing protein n=1 Tax=Rhodopirellula maiorica SM1 TaxID=1265738 RepID=M5S060_9BACT|nr:hypothetical protein [Rhodopirellula maiorica]EMI21042.1 hypothetical protein RMSM_02014 [Rhodopirellula maiorica SM1]